MLDQAIDTSTPSGRLLFHVLGSIAEFERDLIRERVAAGMAAARRRGQHLGRPKALTREAAERLARLHGAGRPQREIAATLGIGKGTVAREVARLKARKSTAA